MTAVELVAHDPTENLVENPHEIDGEKRLVSYSSSCATRFFFCILFRRLESTTEYVSQKRIFKIGSNRIA